VCFVGDDNGDLPAFAALDRLRAGGATTLAVAVAGPETPEAVVAAADVAVDGPAGALALLEVLAGGDSA
jgi:trehalose 6-phosphate phosphatase